MKPFKAGIAQPTGRKSVYLAQNQVNFASKVQSTTSIASSKRPYAKSLLDKKGNTSDSEEEDEEYEEDDDDEEEYYEEIQSSQNSEGESLQSDREATEDQDRSGDQFSTSFISKQNSLLPPPPELFA